MDEIIIFTNAGIHLFATLEETSDEEIEPIISINIGGVFYALKSLNLLTRGQETGSNSLNPKK